MHPAAGPAGVSRELDAAVARVRSATGEIVGSAFLVADTLLVTCAHVVAAALGRSASDESTPQELLNVDFPLLTPVVTAQTKVVGWCPIQGDDRGDVAVLSIAGTPPPALVPARLLSADDLWGHPFRAFGFPRRHDHGVWVSGVLRSRQGVGWVQMEGTASGYAVEGGFSGGAVWDDSLAGVVGMTVAADYQSGVRAAYLIPAEHLIEVWPPLADHSLPPSPYRGLYPFRMQDTEIFFGRQDATDRVVRDAGRRPLVALVGPSGSGKSSVLFAGLLPRAEERGWQVVAVRPAQGRTPIVALAGSLLEALEPELSETQRIAAIPSLADSIRQGQCAEIVDRILTRTKAERLILAIDQFEELFTHDRADVEEFTDVVLSSVRTQETVLGPRLTVVLTLRADFLNKALQLPSLAAALEGSVIAIGQMDRDQLRTVIENPLPIGVRYESGLVDRILDDLGEDAGTLPLLEFALTLLWERQHRGLLTHAAYQELGGVDGALAHYAERVYSEQLLPGDQIEARRLFVQLARPSEVGTPVRRVASPLELGDARWQLAQRLAGTRLIIADRDPSGEQSVELVHEALITGWARLGAWIDDDRTFRVWQEQLRNTRAAWERAGRDPAALMRGAPLAEAERWLVNRPDDIAEAEAAFIKSSVAMRERSVRRLRLTAATLAFLLLLGTGLATLVIVGLRERAQQTLVAGSRDLASQAQRLETHDPKTAMLLAAAAHRMSPTEESTRILTRLAGVHDQLDTIVSTNLPPIVSAQFSPSDPTQLALSGTSNVAILDLTTGNVRNRRFAAEVTTSTFIGGDGTLLIATRGADNRNNVDVWDPSDDRLRQTSIRIPKERSLTEMLVSGDGKLVAACDDRGITVWGLENETKLGRFDTSQATDGCGTGFTADRNLVFIKQGKIVTWNPLAGKIVDTVQAPQSNDRSKKMCGINDESDYRPEIVVAPNGKTAAISDGAGLWWWDLQHERSLQRAGLGDDCALESRVDFASDSNTVLVPNGFGGATVEDVASGQAVAAYEFSQSSNIPPTLSADGQVVAAPLSSSSNSIALLGRRPAMPVAGYWLALSGDDPTQVAAVTDGSVTYAAMRSTGGNFAKPSVVRLPPEALDTEVVDFSPSGHHLASVPESSTDINLYFTTPGEKATFAVLKGHSSEVQALAFDANGENLVSADRAELIVWSVDDETAKRRLKLEDGYTPRQIKISVDQRYIGGVDSNGRALLWDISKSEPVEIAESDAISIDFSPDGRQVSLMTTAGVQIWETSAPTKLRELNLLVNPDYEPAAYFSPDLRHLAIDRIGDSAEALEIWTLPDFQLAGTLYGTGSRAVFLPDSRHLLVTSGSALRVLPFDTDSALATVCRVTGGANLTRPEWNEYAAGFKYVASCP